MIQLNKGTIEQLVVDVRDKLGNLTTLEEKPVTFDVKQRYVDTLIVTGGSPSDIVGLQVFCLIDTTSDDYPAGEEYELFITFVDTDSGETPRLGPLRFEVINNYVGVMS